MLKRKKIHSNFTDHFEKFKIAVFSSSIMKNIVVLPDCCSFAVKLIHRFPFVSASNACCFLKFIAIKLHCSFK